MNDLISREAVNDVIIWHETDGSIAARKALDRIAKLPTVPVIPIPEGVTNGDMIKALFPNMNIQERNNVTLGIKGQTTEFTGMALKEWWNSPYKRGDTDE